MTESVLMTKWPTKTNPNPDYPENSEWGRDDKETDQQVACLERVAKQQQAEAAAELALASALKIIAGKDLLNDRKMMSNAIELERRALRVIRRGLPEIHDAPPIAP
jgi:hypothetical protein